MQFIFVLIYNVYHLVSLGSWSLVGSAKSWTNLLVVAIAVVGQCLKRCSSVTMGTLVTVVRLRNIYTPLLFASIRGSDLDNFLLLIMTSSQASGSWPA